MSKNGFNRTNMSQHNDNQAKAAQELEGGDGKSRVRIEMGKNVFWVIPPTGTAQYYLRYVNVHYKPMHICGRPDPVPDPKQGGKKLINPPAFSKCVRCISAWNKRSEFIQKGTDQKDMSRFQLAINSKFRSDMPTERGLIQVVNVKPFFKVKDGSVVPDKKLIAAYFEAFIDVMNGGTPPEDMPEDMVEAAQAGPQVLALNVETAVLVDTQVKKAFNESDEDPLFSPGEYLLTIERVADGEVPGTDIKKYKHFVDWASDKILNKEGWKAAIQTHAEALIDAVSARAVDLMAQTDSEDLAERARGLIELGDDGINAYLALSNHSYDLPAAVKTQDSSSADDDSDDSDDGSDLPPGMNSTQAPRKAKRASLDSLKEQMRAQAEKDDEDDEDDEDEDD
jgi:hypothetical protein